MAVRQILRSSRLGLGFWHIYHRMTYHQKSGPMAAAYKRFKVCDCRKRGSRIRSEINLCKKFWGIYPLHYYRYDLYRNDKPLSETELIDYIPEFYFYNIFLPHHDTGKYRILLEDKNITEQIFHDADIAQPPTIYKLINRRLFSARLEPKEFSRMEAELSEINCEKVFVKPVDGEGGRGIQIFHRIKPGFYINGAGAGLDRRFLEGIGTENNYIIQAGLSQDNQINAVYGEAINTYRVITENLHGQVRMVCAVLRIGKDHREVDNICQGGLILKINPETGAVGNYAITEEGEAFSRHPDTGYPFGEFSNERWETVKNFALTCAAKLPYFTYLGWDIALTGEGPVAIEANMGFGLDLLQVALGGLREAFGIINPRQNCFKGAEVVDCSSGALS